MRIVQLGDTGTSLLKDLVVKIAVSGGTGFVGRHLARALVGSGQEVVLIARGRDGRDRDIRQLRDAVFAPIDIRDEKKLAQAFTGCGAVAHCAGINREQGEQTYSASPARPSLSRARKR